MTRKFKYDYYAVEIDNWIQADPEKRSGEGKYSPDFHKALEPQIQANRKIKFNWEYGWDTHNSDDSYTPELVEYLVQNAEYLKIHGYGYPVETIQIWNQKNSMYEWNPQEVKYNIIRGGRMVFSNKFRSYLQSEGYAEMAIAGIEDEVHSDTWRFHQTMSPELAIQAIMECYWAGFSCAPISGTIIEWKVAQREKTLGTRKLIDKQVFARIY
jgi:hypothetical protein